MTYRLEPPDSWRPASGEWDELRVCGRCSDIIPPCWRHFMRPCSCTYLPADQPPHGPHSWCELCDGTGFLPCEPQDLSVLRSSGACETCGAWSWELVDLDGVVPGSARHADDEVTDHEVRVVGAPLARSVTEYLNEARGGP